jgi:hypothetical protein
MVSTANVLTNGHEDGKTRMVLFNRRRSRSQTEPRPTVDLLRLAESCYRIPSHPARSARA